MAQKIIPCGGWYIDENTLSFDENKVLSVIGGGGGSGEEIPVPTVEDEGKILAIVNGKYTLVDVQVIKG